MSRLASAFGVEGSLGSRAAYAFRKALSSMLHAPFTHLIAACSVATALLLSVVGGAAMLQARSLLTSWSQRAELTVYLAPQLTDSDGARLVGRIAGLAQGEARYVSADEALDRLAAALGEGAEELRALATNPLPPSIEVIPGAGAPPLEALVAKFEALEGVDEVDRGSEWGERFQRMARGVEAAGAVILPLLLIGAAVLAGSVVRLAVHERRREIEILRLVGATDAFIRAPFLVEGLLSGLVGGIVAALGLLALAAGVGDDLAALPAGASVDLLALASPLSLLAVVGAGALLGLVATALSVERQLR